MKFPVLYALSSTGKIKQWEIEAVGNKMVTRHGYVDAKITETEKLIFGKNIGKKNETTNEKQCELECQSKWQSKIDEQYVEDISALTNYSEAEVILPMLAKSFNKYKHKIKYPCYAQPKLNGVRCTFQNNEFISRTGKKYETLNHLKYQVQKLGLDIPDGEIYIHGMTFEEIIRLVKKEREDNSNSKLEYWIYDKVDDSKSFENRHIEISIKFKSVDSSFIPNLKTVETVIVNNEDEIKQLHDKWVAQGFEGAIIRNKCGRYKVKHRSDDLLKYKEFLDDEFEIVGFDCGTGTEEGCIVFICKTKNDLLFTVRPRGSFDSRKEMYLEGSKFIGEKLTVRYQNLSENGVPIFPVGILIRNYE